MKKTFESDIFDDIDELVRAKDEAHCGVKDRQDRLKTVRQFTNMLETMTEQEAEEAGVTEITNHGLTYKDMLQAETLFVSMVTGTNASLEIVVDTDNPEVDLVIGQKMSQVINRNAIHYKGKFVNFWKKVAGELVISGGTPVTMPEKYGWLPKLRLDMFFPPETSLDAEEIPYSFDPTELSIRDLKKLSAGAKGKYIDKDKIDALIKKIEDQIKESHRDGAISESSKSVRELDSKRNVVTISAWWFYEIKTKDNGDTYVSATLFIDNVTGIDLVTKSDSGAEEASKIACVVAYIDEIDESASDWIHVVSVDAEIGGVKTIDTLRGQAELVYPSGVEMEELLNTIMEGEKFKAKPRLRTTEGANKDDISKWNYLLDTFVPDGLEEFEIKSNSRGLQGPLSLLTQNAAGLSQSSVANSSQGGELRQQALERQQNNGALKNNRLSEAYNHLDAIYESVVYRILAGPTKPGTEGYREIMCIRDKLTKQGIDFKKLASRKYGKFEFLRVRAQRSIGNGDRQEQLDTADWLMTQLPALEPGVRPQVIHRALTLHTQDPDLADALVNVPKAIINAQKITAENEYDTIMRRAGLGQILPIAVDDIHQDHIPVHMLDMQAHVARHSIRPWDKMDVIGFSGMAEHVGEHLKVLLGNPATHPEGQAFLQDYQNITQSAQAVAAEVEQASGNDMNQLTQAEQADLQLKWAKLELEGKKLGMDLAENHKLWQSRASREALAQRSQYTKEINEDRRMKLDATRVIMQGEQKKAAEKKKAAPSKTKTTK